MSSSSRVSSLGRQFLGLPVPWVASSSVPGYTADAYCGDAAMSLARYLPVGFSKPRPVAGAADHTIGSSHYRVYAVTWTGRSYQVMLCFANTRTAESPFVGWPSATQSALADL